MFWTLTLREKKQWNLQPTKMACQFNVFLEKTCCGWKWQAVKSMESDEQTEQARQRALHLAAEVAETDDSNVPVLLLQLKGTFS